MGLIDLLQQKIELFRLEQRYTRGRNRRSTFVSEAQYVDGEYIYSPSSNYSAKSMSRSADQEVPESPMSASSYGSKGSVRGGEASKETKKDRRTSRMGWGSSRQDKRESRLNVREVQWSDGARS